MAESLDEAMPLAQRLDSQNRERQKIERTIAEEATGHVRSCFDPEKDFVIVEGRLHWHIGVVGIVSSRVLAGILSPHVHHRWRRRQLAWARVGASRALIWRRRCASATTCLCATAVTPWRRG
jgi:hypothetical protein